MVEAAQGASRLLRLAYHARLPPHSPRFPWPGRRGLLAAQDHLDHALFSDSEENKATEEYDRAFLKHLVTRTEHAISEATNEDEVALGIPREDWAVNETLLERYIELVSLPAPDASQSDRRLVGAPVPRAIHLRHFFPTKHGPRDPVLGVCDSVVVREEGVAISQGTTGLKTWEASYRLGAYIVQEQNQWQSDNTRVLELGSGSGFLGMVCARLLQGSQAELYLTDLEGSVLDRLHETARLNKVSERVQIAPLDWAEVAESASRAARFLREANATRILAADVVYDPSLVGPLADAMRAALLGNGDSSRHTKSLTWDETAPYALVSSTVRNPATYQAFLDALKQRGMRWKKVSAPLSLWPATEEQEPLPLFPSVHDPETGGIVVLICVQLQP